MVLRLNGKRVAMVNLFAVSFSFLANRYSLYNFVKIESLGNLACKAKSVSWLKLVLMYLA